MNHETNTHLLTVLKEPPGKGQEHHDHSQRTQQVNLLIDMELPEPQVQRIGQVSHRVRIIQGLSNQSLRDADVIFTNGARFDVDRAPMLRWVQVNTDAVNQLADTSLAASDIPVANVHGAYSSDVAEMTIGLLLTLTRKLNACHAFQAKNQWPADDTLLEACSCHGQTIGIIGYGSIGRHIARLVQAMGMKVLACKRHPDFRRDTGYCRPHAGDPMGTIPAAWYGVEDMHDMLQQCHVAICTLPLTTATVGAIGTKQFAALPRGAYFINIGRGTVVDEDALAESLRSGHLAGAALDVFASEPLRTNSPLWSTSNLVITPHIGSWTSGQTQSAVDVLIENLRRDLAGEELINLVDLQAGY